MAHPLETPLKGEFTPLQRHDFAYLSDEEWVRLQQMQDVCGRFAVKDLLVRSIDDQHEALRHFGAKIDALQTQFAPQVAAQPAQASFQGSGLRPLKTEVGVFRGNEGDPLRYWFAELAMAIQARQLSDEFQKVAFALSKLGGRAKTWALGKLMVDGNYFSSFAKLCEELEFAFFPPKNEFRLRSRFLSLTQGKRPLHEFVQECRFVNYEQDRN